MSVIKKAPFKGVFLCLEKTMAESLGTLTVDLLARIGGFVDPMRAAERQADTSSQNIVDSIDEVEVQSSKTSKAISVMAGSIKTALAGISIAQLVSMADGYTQTAARIRNATDSAVEYDLVQKRLYDTANSTFRALSEAQEVYLGLAGGMKSLGYATQDTLDVSDSLSFSFVANAARADQAQSAIDSFSKAMATGKLDGDGWISMVTAADNIIGDVAKTMGVTEAQVRKLGVEGKISLQDLIRTLVETRDQNKALADSMENSLSDGMTKLSNGVTRYVGELNLSLGATDSAAGALGILGDNIDVVANALMVGAAYYAGTYIPAVISGTTAGYAKVAQLVEQIKVENAALLSERAMTTQQIANAQATLVQLASEKALEVERLKAQISAQGRMASITRLAELKKIEAQVTRELAAAEAALAAAQGRSAIASGAIMGMLTGPVGLGLAVAGVAASYFLLRNNTDESTKSFNENGASIADVISKYNQLDEVQRRNQLRTETKSLEELTDAFKDSERQLTATTLSLYRSGEASTDVARQVSNLAMQYKQGELDASQLAAKINDLSGVTAEGKAKVDAQAAAVNKARSELVQQKNITEAMIQRNTDLAKSHDAAANAASNQANKIAELTDKQKEYIDKVTSDVLKEQYIQKQMREHGVSRDRAINMADTRNSAGMGFSAKDGAMPEAIRQAEAQAWALKQGEKARDEAEKRSNDAEKKRESDRNKAANDADNKRKQQFQEREQIQREYADRLRQIDLDLAADSKRIAEANFSPDHAKGYLEVAIGRAKLERSLFIAEQEFEINQHRYTEEQKLEKESEINQLRINANYALTDELVVAQLDAEAERHKQAIAWMNLEQAQRLNDASEAFQTDMQNMDAKYETERKRILLNNSISDQEKERRIGASYRTQDLDMEDSRQRAWLDLQNAVGLDTSVQEAWEQRADAIKSAYEWQLITQQEYQDAMLASEAEYFRAKTSLGLQASADTLSGMTDLMGSLLGEQSAGYKAMFAMSKAFAIAQALINAPKTFSDVYASVASIPYIGPYLAPVMAGAAVAVQLAQVSQIKSTSLTGMAHDGIDYIPKEGTWLLQKGERVLSPKQNMDFTRSLNSTKSRADAVVVNINVPPGYTANQSRGANGEINVDVVRQIAREEAMRPWEQLQSPNSPPSRAMQDSFGLSPNRGG